MNIQLNIDTELTPFDARIELAAGIADLHTKDMNEWQGVFNDYNMEPYLLRFDGKHWFFRLKNKHALKKRNKIKKIPRLKVTNLKLIKD